MPFLISRFIKPQPEPQHPRIFGHGGIPGSGAIVSDAPLLIRIGLALIEGRTECPPSDLDSSIGLR